MYITVSASCVKIEAVKMTYGGIGRLSTVICDLPCATFSQFIDIITHLLTA